MFHTACQTLGRVGLPALFLVLTAPAWAADDIDCLVCHEDAGNFEGLSRAARLVVSTGTLEASIHGQMGIACVDCHQDLAEGDVTHPGPAAPVDCGICHSDVEETYGAGIHGFALERGSARAPTCAACHGSHDILPSTDPGSRTHAARVQELCSGCHGQSGLRTADLVRLPSSALAYAESVHGVGRASGNLHAATCTDCHGVHDLAGPGDPASRIHRSNAAATCGTCHVEAAADYRASIHGRALDAGVYDSPTCTDCHGEHEILSPTDPDARTYLIRLAAETCGKCHDDPGKMRKYGLDSGVVGSYVDSYHGWATRRDYERAASCVSCHGAHRVLPAADPDSTTHAANVTETCRTCHKGATERFASAYSHQAASIDANPINRAIRLVYLALIWVVIGGMALHNGVILIYHLQEKRRREEAGAVQRLDGIQIVQHLAMAIVFVVLAVTGFALRFPEAWWVRWLAVAGLSEPVRAWVHRAAGLVLIAVAISHVAYVMLVRRGREEFREMLPDRHDWPSFVANLRFHVWRSPHPPRFGRYDYTQKAEYWALVWGTALMIVTGFVLWFPALTVRLLPAWVVAASQTVHYYEAWLATLAIVVWHFFFVFVHPDHYPISWTWITGKMPEAVARHHHARWWDEELAAPPAKGPDRAIEPGVEPPSKG